MRNASHYAEHAISGKKHMGGGAGASSH